MYAKAASEVGPSGESGETPRRRCRLDGAPHLFAWSTPAAGGAGLGIAASGRRPGDLPAAGAPAPAPYFQLRSTRCAPSAHSRC